MKKVSVKIKIMLDFWNILYIQDQLNGKVGIYLISFHRVIIKILTVGDLKKQKKLLKVDDLICGINIV